jgi:hypothetical protein
MNSIIDLIGKCVEGMQIPHQRVGEGLLQRKDQGYEFHFSWLLILIAFFTWEMEEGATSPEVEPSEPLAARFTTMWYSSDMAK